MGIIYKNGIPYGNQPSIDATLTHQGEAADAKATGDAVSELRNTLNNYLNDIDITFTGGASNIYKFDIQIIKGFKYFVTNNTSGNISLNVYKNGTSTTIFSVVTSGATIYFIAADDYDQIGGWFNYAGDIRVKCSGEATIESENNRRIEKDIVGSNFGVGFLDLYSEFDRGNMYQGVINEAYLYRVRSNSIITADMDMTLYAEEGFQFVLNLYSSGVYTSSVDWSDSYFIREGTEFRVLIKRLVEDTTEIADIDLFVKSVYFHTSIGKAIEENEKGIDYLNDKLLDSITPAFEQGQIIGGFQSDSNKAVRNQGFTYLPKGSNIIFKSRNFQIIVNCYYYSAANQNFYTGIAGGVTVNANTEGIYTTTKDGYVRISVTKGSGADFAPSELADLVIFIATSTKELEKKIALDYFGSAMTLGDIDISSKLSSYCSLITGDESDNYLFFTDSHNMGANGLFSDIGISTGFAKLDKYYKHSPCSFILFGGDALNSGDTPDQAKYKLGYFRGLSYGLFGDDLKMMVGNHDYNYAGTESISEKTIANLFYPKIQRNYYTFDTENTSYYVLDTGIESDDTLTVYRLQQLDWLCGALLNNAKAHKVLLFHVYYIIGTTVSTMAQKIGDIISAFNNRDGIILYPGSGYNFANAQGKIEYSLVGHSHADFNVTLGGVPLIASINFSNDYSFDLVNVNYTEKKVNLVRVGTGSNRTIDLT